MSYFLCSQADRLYIISWPQQTELNIYLLANLFTDLSMLPFLSLCTLSLHWIPQPLLPLHAFLLTTSSISLSDFCWTTLLWASETSEPFQTERFSTRRTGASGQLCRIAPHLFPINCNWGVNSKVFSLKEMVFAKVESMHAMSCSFLFACVEELGSESTFSSSIAKI